jgi:branched-chain amino acid aminotransferase
MFAYVNGVMVEETNAAVTVFDHGLTVGDGVFETIALRQGTAKAPTRHLARLARSASGLGLPVPDIEELHRAVGETIAANPGIDFGAIRVTYTSGPGTVGSSRDDVATTTIVAARHLSPPPPVTDVITVPWPRNERGALAGLKTTSYAENVKALAEAHKRGASEAIFANTTGALCEGSGTNVFVVIDGQLITPPLSAGCLAGITRGLIIERAGVDVHERDVPIDELRHAEEAFITSAIRDIQAIASVDDQPLGSAPGPLTQKAIHAYAALLAADPDPA